MYDIADLYKAELAIPIAFDIAAEGAEDIPAATRRAVRDQIYSGKLLPRCVQDIKTLLMPDDQDDSPDWEADVVYLWDEKGSAVASGQSYEDPADVPW